MKSIRQVTDLENKRVLVRVDFNVPVLNGIIVDDSRIRAVCPTIDFLIKHGAKVILVTHFGRPDGEVMEDFRVDPIAIKASEIFGVKVKKINEVVGEEATFVVNAMQKGEIIMLENIRFLSDEKNNTGTLAHDLANLADIFVLDGFGISHRASASVVGINKYIPSYAGLLLENEITELEKVLKNPDHPFVAVIGGAKIETKIPVLKKLLEVADKILIGGALMNTYLKADGYEVCDSLVDDNCGDEALEYMKHEKIMLPIDWVVGSKDGTKTRITTKDDEKNIICNHGEAIFDIGPKTREEFRKEIIKAKLVIWNGAMGFFEQPPYNEGTDYIANTIVEAGSEGAYTLVGGGETVQVIEMLGLIDKIGYVSTGGGAMLEYLSGKELPGITALTGITALNSKF